VIDHATTQSSLLMVWEQGQRERAGRRALSLLVAAAPSDAPGDLSAATVGRRDAALIDLRERLFGRRFLALSTCPACGEAIEIAFDADEVRRRAAGASRAALHVGGVDLQVRVPTGSDAIAIEAVPDVTSARAALVARCIEVATRDGEPIALGDLPSSVVDAAVARMNELDPQADVALDVDCPSCAHAWREPFDIVSFLWTELAAWARRLLEDVHLIAAAYGWAERDILGLSPVRRR
jgi:hypothetical protein